MTEQRDDILEPVDPLEDDTPAVTWDEWLTDNGLVWPVEDDAPEQFERIP